VLVPALVGLEMCQAYKRALISGVVLTPTPPETLLSVRGVISSQHPGPGTPVPVAQTVYVQISPAHD
jgi:beta-lactam-binding protein with PASTA domain